MNVLLLLAGLILLTPPPARQQSPIGFVSIEGVVLEAGTEQHLPDVQVSLPIAGAPPVVTFTDAQGRFTFEQVQPGHHRLSAEKEGYAPARVSNRKLPGSPGIPVTAAAGEPVRGLRIQMDPEAVIEGRVLDDAGQPVVRAVISAERHRYHESGGRVLTPAASARTDDRGHYRVSGLASGEYFIRVRPPSLVAAAQNQAYVQVYYPGTRDSSKAVPVAVDAGSELRVDDIALPSVKAAPVRLRITNMTGQTPHLTVVELREKGKPVSMNVGSAGARADFEIPAVAPGMYEIAVGMAQGPVLSFERFDVAVGQSPVEREVVVRRGVRLGGRARVQNPDGSVRPARGARISLRVDGSAQGGSAMSSEDGTFVIEGISPGHHRVRLGALPPGQYLKAVREGGRDVTAEGVRITGETSIEVLLGASGGIIEGEVTNSKGQRVSDAVVALVPDPPLRSAAHLYRTANSGHNGVFAIQGIAPGSYRLFAWSELEGPAYRNEEFMKEYEEDGSPVEVDAGDRLTLHPKLLDEDSASVSP